MHVEKCPGVEIFILSLSQCKIKQILKWIRAYVSSNAHEIELSSMRENSYARKKFIELKFNAGENLYISFI